MTPSRVPIPPGRVDLHCHLLPGIDDGAVDEDDSLALCRVAREDGTAATAATPHMREETYPNTLASVVEALAAFDRVRAERREAHIVLLGAEVFLRPDLPELYRRGLLPTYGGHGRHFLLELPDYFPEEAVAGLVADLVGAGVRPVIAHPERNLTFVRRPEALHRLVVGGALSQVTAGSLTGSFGKEALRAGRRFVESRWAHFLASDAHNTFLRTPVLSEGLRAATAWIGAEAERLVDAHPRAVLEGREVEAPEPGAVDSPRRSFLGKWLGGT